MWIARDKDGCAGVFEEKPLKDDYYESWSASGIVIDMDDDFLNLAGINVEWEDKEPVEVVISIHER
ncbi:hypothetical protein Barb6XT_00085 [Bacteroidales bacterium Barb6XT]|nr:hypothetical protein Barb6XT_00943 [Bacteroidales bacterium Barb6XT]OAV68683.1 hypothetical protein Barb6XT_00858 [Bacteroidales bacterium Barb6XT]OAV70049.1 hypothetical protein Barb6XT_00085 [Bacteroidales bacterium Barb6XT]